MLKKGDEIVNYERAMEIFNSPKTFEVLYNGSPVWIDGLDPRQQKATISSGDLDEGRVTVSVKQLTESDLL